MKAGPLLFAFILFAAALPLAPQKKTTDPWPGEVDLLITPREKERYQGLRKRQDRERFQEIFWARRDPTPGTALNEFRVIFNGQRRRALESAEGDSEETRLLTMFGLPAERESNPGENRVSWHYRQAPFYTPFPPPFSLHLLEGRLERERNDPAVIDFIENFSERVLFQPVYVLDPRSLPETRLNPENAAHKQVLELAAGELAPQPDLSARIIQAGTNSPATHVSFLLQTSNETTEVFFAVVLQHLDFPAIRYESLQRSLPFRNYKQNNYFSLGAAVIPGPYRYACGFFTQAGKQPMLTAGTIEVDNFRPGLFILGTVLMGLAEQKTSNRKESAPSAFTIGNRSFVPYLAGKVEYAENLFLLIPVYNPRPENGTVRLQASYHLQGPREDFTITPPEMKGRLEEGEKLLSIVVEIPISELDSGEWKLNLKLEDQVGKSSASQELVFTVQ